jgi:hypothetical protein
VVLSRVLHRHRDEQRAAHRLSFYLVITPFGLLMRAFGRDPMNRAWIRRRRPTGVQRRSRSIQNALLPPVLERVDNE